MERCEIVREKIRSGSYSGPTSGLCPGRLQANIVILPRDLAEDFLNYCLANPRPCPLVGLGDAGDPYLRDLGDDLDIRTDVSRYVVHRDGVAIEEHTDIRALWQPNFVTFALGCSFTFENALIATGIPMRHIEAGTTVPMFRTNVSTVPNAVFGSDLVVSMRPIAKERLADVRAICDRYPFAHGAPVHVGDPSEIGIRDVGQPDWGDPSDIREGEVCAFWACGVTTQMALAAARVPFAITHKPGAMLITDVPETEGRIIGGRHMI
ncbi:putative hydro-lyase [Defluviimonas sp. WL0075]|uniref:Hydro-lyase n=1 Tax=Albidovulum sediminicola TaxID=2984331 RepID=A0ABT2Z5A6_9RHOB|nr:putative hydro-lyase [Defluviimonas sp. WL0075]MCV2866301.1 putative hydro-lyase [Defluviimonas sp. WL0075]